MPGHPDGDVRSWVWSPHGTPNIHQPDRWGVVQFASASVDSNSAAVEERPNRSIRWALRRLYYLQQEHYDENGSYAESLSALDTSDVSFPDGFKPTLNTTQTMYEITAPGADGTVLHIRQDGRAWTTETKPQ